MWHRYYYFKKKMLAAAVYEMRTRKYYDSKCEQHKTLFEKMLSDDGIAVHPLHRCEGRVLEDRPCDDCKQPFLSYGKSTRITRYSDGHITLMNACCGTD